MTPEITKKKGRPAGSNSFVKIRLQDLMAVVGAGATVPVSKVWLREMGINTEAVVMPAPVSIPAANDEPEEKIQFTLTPVEED